jgi:hypothetical protein
MKDKSGKQITTKEFFTRWGKGIKDVVRNPSPLEKVSLDLQSSYIIMLGYIVSFIALAVFRDSLGWLSYGLLLIFLGNIISQFFKIVGLRSQMKIFKNFEKQFEGGNDEEGLFSNSSK